MLKGSRIITYFFTLFLFFIFFIFCCWSWVLWSIAPLLITTLTLLSALTILSPHSYRHTLITTLLSPHSHSYHHTLITTLLSPHSWNRRLDDHNLCLHLTNPSLVIYISNIRSSMLTVGFKHGTWHLFPYCFIIIHNSATTWRNLHKYSSNMIWFLKLPAVNPFLWTHMVWLEQSKPWASRR